jgi:hypothetical protein
MIEAKKPPINTPFSTAIPSPKYVSLKGLLS